MKYKNALFILSNGRIASIYKKDGQLLWENKIKTYLGKTVANSIGQIMQEDDKLYVGVYGYLLCLNAKDGSLIWKNELKGWGFQFVSIANAGNNSTEAAVQQSANSSAAVVAAAT